MNVKILLAIIKIYGSRICEDALMSQRYMKVRQRLRNELQSVLSNTNANIHYYKVKPGQYSHVLELYYTEILYYDTVIGDNNFISTINEKFHRKGHEINSMFDCNQIISLILKIFPKKNFDIFIIDFTNGIFNTFKSFLERRLTDCGLLNINIYEGSPLFYRTVLSESDMYNEIVISDKYFEIEKTNRTDDIYYNYKFKIPLDIFAEGHGLLYFYHIEGKIRFMSGFSFHDLSFCSKYIFTMKNMFEHPSLIYGILTIRLKEIIGNENYIKKTKLFFDCLCRHYFNIENLSVTDKDDFVKISSKRLKSRRFEPINDICGLQERASSHIDIEEPCSNKDLQDYKISPNKIYLEDEPALNELIISDERKRMYCNDIMYNGTGGFSERETKAETVVKNTDKDGIQASKANLPTTSHSNKEHFFQTNAKDSVDWLSFKEGRTTKELYDAFASFCKNYEREIVIFYILMLDTKYFNCFVFRFFISPYEDISKIFLSNFREIGLLDYDEGKLEYKIINGVYLVFNNKMYRLDKIVSDYIAFIKHHTKTSSINIMKLYNYLEIPSKCFYLYMMDNNEDQNDINKVIVILNMMISQNTARFKTFIDDYNNFLEEDLEKVLNWH